MDSSGYRLKIVYREAVWKVVPIPTNHIKWMRGIYNFVNHVLLLDFDQKFTFFVIGLEIFRKLIIALAKRRVLQHLAKPIPVSLWGVDRVEALGVKDAIIFGIKVNLIDHSAWND